MNRLLLLLPLLATAGFGASRATRVGACPEPMRGVNGLPLRQEAIVKDGVTYVPLRAVAESLGCTVDGACPERTRGDPKAGVFVWGRPQSPHLPGLPSDGASAPPPFPPDPRPVTPQPPMPEQP